MSNSANMRRKGYVYNLKYRSKLICLIRGPGNSLDECKVLGDFGTKYAKIRPTKYHRHKPAPKIIFGRYQQNNAIVEHAVDEIMLQDNKKLSLTDETHDNIDSEVGKDKMYELDKMIFDQKE